MLYISWLTILYKIPLALKLQYPTCFATGCPPSSARHTNGQTEPKKRIQRSSPVTLQTIPKKVTSKAVLKALIGWITNCGTMTVVAVYCFKCTLLNRGKTWTENFYHITPIYGTRFKSGTRIHEFSITTSPSSGYVVAQLVETLRYKPEGRGFDSRWSQWNFSVT